MIKLELENLMGMISQQKQNLIGKFLFNQKLNSIKLSKKFCKQAKQSTQSSGLENNWTKP